MRTFLPEFIDAKSACEDVIEKGLEEEVTDKC
jgi:hypothetical protein